MTTNWSSPTTDEMGSGDSAPGAIYEPRSGRVPRRRIGGAPSFVAGIVRSPTVFLTAEAPTRANPG